MRRWRAYSAATGLFSCLPLGSCSAAICHHIDPLSFRFHPLPSLLCTPSPSLLLPFPRHSLPRESDEPPCCWLLLSTGSLRASNESPKVPRWWWSRSQPFWVFWPLSGDEWISGDTFTPPPSPSPDAVAAPSFFMIFFLLLIINRKIERKTCSFYLVEYVVGWMCRYHSSETSILRGSLHLRPWPPHLLQMAEFWRAIHSLAQGHAPSNLTISTWFGIFFPSLWCKWRLAWRAETIFPSISMQMRPHLNISALYRQLTAPSIFTWRIFH